VSRRGRSIALKDGEGSAGGHVPDPYVFIHTAANESEAAGAIRSTAVERQKLSPAEFA
jgi:hypothetical protein